MQFKQSLLQIPAIVAVHLPTTVADHLQAMLVAPVVIPLQRFVVVVTHAADKLFPDDWVCAEPL